MPGIKYLQIFIFVGVVVIETLEFNQKLKLKTMVKMYKSILQVLYLFYKIFFTDINTFLYVLLFDVGRNQLNGKSYV